MRIAVIGGGRMGLPLACMFAKHGADVVVSDANEAIASAIDAGHCLYEEPGLRELMLELHAARRLSGTSDTIAATGAADCVVVIVPAHLTPDRDIDFSVLLSASADVGKGLRPGTLIVYETTVSIGGTRRMLVPELESSSGLKAGVDFFVGYSPERVKANHVLARLETTPKVIGGIDDESRRKTAALYRDYLGAPIADVGTVEAAESAKLLGMLYRDVNIALANELAAFCEVAGVDFERVREVANSDGEASLLLPGIGVGGHCTPVYPYFLTRESRRLGLTQRLSEAAREINDAQPVRQVRRLQEHWSDLAHRRVHILGLGFRPGVKVDTFSPAYDLKGALERLGAIVTIEDPCYEPAEVANAGFRPGHCFDAEVIVLNTAHPEYGNPDFRQWRRAGVEAVLDGRNLWDQAEVESAGIVYFGIGRSSRIELETSCRRQRPARSN